MTQVAIGLGSNVGNRAGHLDYALARLAGLLDGLVVSARYDTEPVGVGPQPTFLNQAAVGRTSRTARILLDELLVIENRRGRERPHRGAPRTLDLDLILFGDLVCSEPGLDVPHPRFRERAFVLLPLAEIAAGMRDPVTGLTVADLRDRLMSRT